MLVSYRWLLELCPVDATPETVAHWLTARGLTVDSIDADAVEDDVVLDVDVPANRPDCLGLRGIAREMAAAAGRRMETAPADPDVSGDPVDAGFSIAIDDADLCGRFTGTLVRGVKVGPSPESIVRRLRACGLRSVNNVVDVSNLVLLETGQPIHFYDAATVRGGELRARRARDGEHLRTLDDQERTLTTHIPVIADGERVVGIAGVMGGADTEIGDASRDVLIEAAWFEPTAIRRTSRALGLSTDASYRFERGCDPEGPAIAQNLARRLLAEHCGGVPAPGRIDVRPGGPPSPAPVALRHDHLVRLLGFDPGREAIVSALGAVGFAVHDGEAGVLHATPPTWRVDVTREADLIEEVARDVGYDRVPAHLPAAGGAPVAGSTHPLDEPARTLLAHLGFHEAFNYAMVAPGEDEPFVDPGALPATRLTNPIADNLAVLRRSILPGLLSSVDRNLRRGSPDVRLFEVGHVFLPSTDEGAFPAEPLRVGLAWAGVARSHHWSGPAPAVEWADMAGVVERLLDALRPGAGFEPSAESALPGLHPGKSLRWTSPGGDRPAARAGVLHPDRRAALDLDTDVVLAEIDLDRVLATAAEGFRYRPVPRLPSATRDLSLVLAAGTPYRDVVDTLRRVPAPADARFEVVDRYVGPPLAEGEVSLTVRVILQPLDRTLTDAESETYRSALVAALEATGSIRLRS